MSSSFEKSVKGGTKQKLAAPKSKYVEHILVATHSGEAGVAEIFRVLQNRLRDSTWTIVFKSLIIVHLMIREGEPEVTLRYIAKHPSKLAISNFTEAQVQGKNIKHYTQYLLGRARSYRETKLDYVRTGEGRLKRLSVDKGLLRETESVQRQIGALLKADLLSNEPENEISLCAFRLLTMDLLILFHIMNEGMINLLEHYFEMSKYDAERALEIYKTFSKQTNQVVEYLAVARQFENSTRLEIPKLKHAPTSLTNSLEEYLNDPDFEVNRRQYLLQQEARKGRTGTNGGSKSFGEERPAPSKTEAGKNFPSPKPAQAAPAQSQPRGPAPDLIDFFESIEDNQQPMAQQTQQVPQYVQPPQVQQSSPYQQTGFPGGYPAQQQQSPQQGSYGQTNGSFAPAQQQPLPQDFTGAGFGGYTPQPQQSFSSQSSLPSIPQNGVASFPQQNPQQFTGQPQSTNPFRQSMMPQNFTGTTNTSYPSSQSVASPINRQSTNPFAKPVTAQPTSQTNPFPMPQQNQAPQSQFQQSTPPIQPAPTGTNPFARMTPPQQPTQATASQPNLQVNPTGSTNPFRQSVFHNPQTGQPWQPGQGTMGGLEQLETVPIFPRPGQPNIQNQPNAWS